MIRKCEECNDLMIVAIVIVCEVKKCLRFDCLKKIIVFIFQTKFIYNSVHELKNVTRLLI